VWQRLDGLPLALELTACGAAWDACGVAHIQACPEAGRRSAGGDNRALPQDTNMQYKALGNTGLIVSRICLGTMTFGSGPGFFKVIGTVDQDGADELVKGAYDRGVNFFDTADVYHKGESEQILGQSFKHFNIPRNEVVIATKVYSRVGPGRNDVGASREHIMDGVEASLRRLQTDYIDLYQIHANDSLTPVEETLRALDTLVNQGKVRYIGVSNWQAWKLAKALTISEWKNLARFATLQAYYSIASRDLERELVPLLQAEKTGLLAWSPLAGGLLSASSAARTRTRRVLAAPNSIFRS
jgi:aryl-alcohol dehydrogenase-like predicted oxidoreductase